MSEYVPLLILDDEDTPQNESMSLREFLTEIDLHVNNVNGATPDNVFVNLKITDYDDDEFYELSFAELIFSMKKESK